MLSGRPLTLPPWLREISPNSKAIWAQLQILPASASQCFFPFEEPVCCLRGQLREALSGQPSFRMLRSLSSEGRAACGTLKSSFPQMLHVDLYVKAVQELSWMISKHLAQEGLKAIGNHSSCFLCLHHLPPFSCLPLFCYQSQPEGKTLSPVIHTF